jgi:hypothetical protein
MVCPCSGRAGIGRRDVFVVVRGQTPVATPVAVMSYFPPSLLSLTPNSTGTDGGNLVTLFGANLGDATMRAFGTVMVRFHRSVCTNGTCPVDALCDCSIVSHSHTAITLRTPPGIGRQHK